MNGFKRLAALVVLASFAGCDYIERRENARERSDANYRAAMADYAAGRLDAAIGGFEKVIRGNPANASARFQLACLLQDCRKDYLGALCHYREYTLLDPESDKSTLAASRLALCEKLLATELARKLNLTENSAAAEEIARLRAEAAEQEKKLAAADEEIRRLKADVASVEAERARLMRLVEFAGDEDEAAKPGTIDERALLDEEEESVDRRAIDAEAAELAAIDAAEQKDRPYELKPVKQPEPKADPYPHEARPPEYVVQEGDTLYKLAMRFYGQRSKWKAIRDANPAVISMDGRIRSGMKIKLP